MAIGYNSGKAFATYIELMLKCIEQLSNHDNIKGLLCLNSLLNCQKMGHSTCCRSWNTTDFEYENSIAQWTASQCRTWIGISNYFLSLPLSAHPSYGKCTLSGDVSNFLPWSFNGNFIYQIVIALNTNRIDLYECSCMVHFFCFHQRQFFNIFLITGLHLWIVNQIHGIPFCFFQHGAPIHGMVCQVGIFYQPVSR